MKNKARFFFFLIFFLMIKSVYSEDKKPFKPRFSLKLSGGTSSFVIGDLNKSLDSINNNAVFEYWRQTNPERVVGNIRKLDNRTADWEVELRIDISPKIGFGVATSGPFHIDNKSYLIYTYVYNGYPATITALTFKPEIKVAMPIKLSIYYVPIRSSRANIFLKGGISYYPGKISEYLKYEVTEPFASYWYSVYWGAESKFSLGFHGGVGVEYDFNKNLALVMEFQARYVKIRTLQGRVELENDLGIFYEERGTLYYFHQSDYGIQATYDKLEVRENPPEGGTWDIPHDVRKAILDLSGFSLKIGIRIRLF